jgi:hypothetical protein
VNFNFGSISAPWRVCAIYIFVSLIKWVLTTGACLSGEDLIAGCGNPGFLDANAADRGFRPGL